MSKTPQTDEIVGQYEREYKSVGDIIEHAQQLETELSDIKAQFTEYVLAEDAWRNTVIGSHRDERRLTASQLRSKAKETLGL